MQLKHMYDTIQYKKNKNGKKNAHNKAIGESKLRPWFTRRGSRQMPPPGEFDQT